jgi:hypothetical protein
MHFATETLRGHSRCGHPIQEDCHPTEIAKNIVFAEFFKALIGSGDFRLIGGNLLLVGRDFLLIGLLIRLDICLIRGHLLLRQG